VPFRSDNSILYQHTPQGVGDEDVAPPVGDQATDMAFSLLSSLIDIGRGMGSGDSAGLLSSKSPSTGRLAALTQSQVGIPTRSARAWRRVYVGGVLFALLSLHRNAPF